MVSTSIILKFTVTRIIDMVWDAQVGRKDRGLVRFTIERVKSEKGLKSPSITLLLCTYVLLISSVCCRCFHRFIQILGLGTMDTLEIEIDTLVQLFQFAFLLYKDDLLSMHL